MRACRGARVVRSGRDLALLAAALGIPVVLVPLPQVGRFEAELRLAPATGVAQQEPEALGLGTAGRNAREEGSNVVVREPPSSGGADGLDAREKFRPVAFNGPEAGEVASSVDVGQVIVDHGRRVRLGLIQELLGHDAVSVERQGEVGQGARHVGTAERVDGDFKYNLTHSNTNLSQPCLPRARSPSYLRGLTLSPHKKCSQRESPPRNCQIYQALLVLSREAKKLDIKKPRHSAKFFFRKLFISQIFDYRVQ